MNVINDVDLIFWVEQFRHLYDKKVKDYKDRNVVENSWLFIGNKLKSSSEYITIYLININYYRNTNIKVFPKFCLFCIRKYMSHIKLYKYRYT